MRELGSAGLFPLYQLIWSISAKLSHQPQTLTEAPLAQQKVCFQSNLIHPQPASFSNTTRPGLLYSVTNQLDPEEKKINSWQNTH